ncbi:hypothetical protein [Bradyrhizobium viridifuturi]|uniref:hypothetical protein n=1 Tax=Bradyrhizobium viridifuturi TaxID=1654716 RepID=UPI00067EA287|nr:hypothetical protein [Bradyrhizobium viridifuturi]
MGPIERTQFVLSTALALAQKASSKDIELRALGALIAMQFINGESDAARSSIRRFIRSASAMGDAAAQQIGQRLLGNALLFAGKLSYAQMRLERVLERASKPLDQRGPLLFRYDNHAMARGMLARVLWLRGAVDRAIQELAPASRLSKVWATRFRCAG